MNKKIIIPTILFIAVLFFSFFALSQEKNKNYSQANEPAKEENQIILYYGESCPHCALVEKYIEENKINDKISFARKEVYSNQDNAKELQEKAKICGLSADSIGVPFLWDGGKCLIGGQDIINFFKQNN